MCIIVYKPAEAGMPTKNLLKRLYNANPDGAGFMYADGESVTGKKGHMSFKAYWRAIQRERDGRESLPWVFHMRIATHGGKGARMSHPFPLSESPRALTRCEWTAAAGVAHNGIISLTDYAVTLSDTAEFVRAYAAPLLSAAGWERWALDLLEESASGSRLALMDASGRVELLGTWHESDGLYFSNAGYKREPKKTSAIDWSAYLPDVPHYACYHCDGDICDYCERDEMKGGETLAGVPAYSVAYARGIYRGCDCGDI